MSHSQFHCTGRAYLDMHGLIFETSICYWQDQPGRSAVSRERRRRATSARPPLERRAAGRTGSARGAHREAPAGAAGGGGGGGGGRWTRYRGEEGEGREARRDPETPAGTTDPDPLPARPQRGGGADPSSPPARRNPGVRTRSRRQGGHADRTASPPTGDGAATPQSGARGPARARDRGRTPTATAAAATAGNPRGAACTGTRRGRARGGP